MSEKFKNLVIYISDRCREDKNFGATKLNKILFMIDFSAYGIWGNPISGTIYRRLEQGPVPANMHLIRDRLVAEGRVSIEERLRFGHTQKRLVPLVAPDLSEFFPEEIDLIDQVIEDFWRKNATELSEWTHTLQPWLLTVDKEEIPYHTIFALKKHPVGRSGIEWGMSKLESLQV